MAGGRADRWRSTLGCKSRYKGVNQNSPGSLTRILGAGPSIAAPVHWTARRRRAPKPCRMAFSPAGPDATRFLPALGAVADLVASHRQLRDRPRLHCDPAGVDPVREPAPRPRVQNRYSGFLRPSSSCAAPPTGPADLVTLWVPAYRVSAILMVATAIVSVATAITVWHMLPLALTIPPPAQLRAADRALRQSEDMLRMSADIARIGGYRLDIVEGRMHCPAGSAPHAWLCQQW